MALSDPADTLAYHQSRVFCQHRNMLGVPVAAVAAKVKHYMLTSGSTTVPEAEALWFYGMNHGIALIAGERAPYEPLPKTELDFVNAYHEVLGEKAVRAFYYLLLICTREFRHCQSLKKDLPAINTKYGSPVGAFFSGIQGGEAGIHQALLDSPPATSIGQYTKALQWGFYNGKWSSGFGGPAWGKVTDCLVRFVSGEFSAEMMMDTVWTLAHNNGPIFNKGMLYACYTAKLLRILDVQRSGQVPEAVLTDPVLAGIVHKEVDLRLRMEWLAARFPTKIGSYVDWFQVEALGAVGNYEKEQSQQLAVHGASLHAAEKEAKKAAAIAAAEAKKKAIEAKKAKEKAEYAKKHFVVMPGLVLEKIDRKAA